MSEIFCAFCKKETIINHRSIRVCMDCLLFKRPQGINFQLLFLKLSCFLFALLYFVIHQIVFRDSNSSLAWASEKLSLLFLYITIIFSVTVSLISWWKSFLVYEWERRYLWRTEQPKAVKLTDILIKD